MISVIIGTFGDSSWNQRGQSVAASLSRQTVPPASIHHVHAATLCEARNTGAQDALGEWLLFLDADDYLDDDFIKEAREVLMALPEGQWLVRPAIELSSETIGSYVLPEKNLFDENFMIIGTMVRKELFLEVGMFADLPVLEDWDLWLRCRIAGAEYASADKAIYKIVVVPASRNFATPKVQYRVSQEIRGKYRRHRR